jgi:flagellar basal body-associated protein FliL
MSNVILGFVLLVMIVSAILLVFIVAFGGAVLVFSRSDRKEKEQSRFPAEGQQVADQKTI